MEPPLAPPLPATDSVNSSPRSRNADSWDDSFQNTTLPKLRLMCSFGGHIVPRPHDKSLCYIGGDTRIIVVDRQSSLSDLNQRLSKTLLNSAPSFSIKYQLPNEDLDSLISVTTDEDFDNMIDEYDRLNNNSAAAKSSRLRIFLFPVKPDSVSSIGSLLENSTKSEDWFLNALNGTNSGPLSDSNSVNCLLGLDDDAQINNNQNNLKPVSGGGGNISKNQDVHSVPDSPMLDTSSSFGSASSSPSLANLPPIRVHAIEDQHQKVVGIEEQFIHMGISGGNANQRLDDGGFVVLSSQPQPTVLPVASGVPMSSAQVLGDYSNRIISDDERSDQGGVPMGYRKQVQQQTQALPSQFHQKQTGVGLDSASPKSVSSDGGVPNPVSRQKPMIYQDPNGQGMGSANLEPKTIDPSSRLQMPQQFQESGYILPSQYDPQHHPQLQQQQPQFIHAGGQYIQQHPTGAVPMASYYMYPSQQSHHPQQPVYYVPARQPQTYNMTMQQQGYSEAAITAPSSHSQNPTATVYNAARNAPGPSSEMAAGVYRTAATSTPSYVQVPSNQHQQQYAGFSQIQHPSQSNAPTLATTANYTYEFADPSQAHMYYTPPLAPQLAAQYQTMTSNLAEANAPHPTDGIKQQVRTSQP